MEALSVADVEVVVEVAEVDLSAADVEVAVAVEILEVAVVVLPTVVASATSRERSRLFKVVNTPHRSSFEVMC